MTPRGGSAGGGDRKVLQLAAQIARSVETTLVGECRDEVLSNTSVEKVEPAPGNRMNVTLRVHAPGAALPKHDVLARLERYRGLIRDRLVQDVNRRSIPELTFWLVRDPADAAGGTEGIDDAQPPSILDDL